MKVSLGWLKNELGRTMMSDQQVAVALESAGIEVEEVISSAAFDKKLQIVLVKKVVQHPQADRLHLVLVTNGKQDFSIVCGAPNVREGLKTVLAQVGTTLPSGDKIEKVKLRGEISEGMLCSVRELGLGREHDGIIEISDEVGVGTQLSELYPSDSVADIKTPANRFDVLSVVGLAREVAAILDIPYDPAVAPAVVKYGKDPAVKPGAEADRYLLADISLDQKSASSDWMRARLRAAGMRSVNAVVDVTNYVMLELGQPLHAFDASKVKPPLAVRRAKAGEGLVTLDGEQRKLTAEDLVITDSTGPIALAGVMGGAATEVRPETREILLEAAVFDAATVRKMAKRHGLRTEASARFERGLPVELPPLAVARAQQLLKELAAGQLVAVSDQLNVKPQKRQIELSETKLVRLLGFEVTAKQAVAALARLGISAEVGGGRTLVVNVLEVPWWRPDLRLPEDLVEEVVRVIGYEKVPSTLPQWRPQRLVFDRMRAKRRQVRDLLYAAGLFEVATYAFVAKDQLTDLGYELAKHLKLKNPLSSEQAYLRSSLLPGHLAVMARNRQYAQRVGFYELSAVFVPQGPGELPQEPLRLGVMLRRPKQVYREIKGVLDALAWDLNVELHVEPAEDNKFAPGRCGVVRLGKQTVGWIGQVDPRKPLELKIDGEIGYFELDMMPVLAVSGPKQFAGLAKFPVITRDLTVVVPIAVTWREILTVLGDMAHTQAAFVGDYYGRELPTGHKSVTLSLTIAHPDRTPREEEAVEIEGKVRSVLSRKLGGSDAISAVGQFL